MTLYLQLVSTSLHAGSPRLALLHLRRSCEFNPRVSMSSYSPPPPPPRDQSMDTEAPNAPITRERRLNPDLQEQLPKPYLARALEAVDPSHPQGTKGRDPRGMSVLQQHAAFFDRNGDGVIYPWETFQGLRAIGCGLTVSFAFSILINLFLSYPTQPGWLPSPLLSIRIDNIHKGKHGSDSETYDTEGRFDPSKFDAVFSKYGRTHPNALTKDELSSMLQGNRNTYDFLGWLAAAGEWLLLYSLAKDKDGLLQRETVRGLFDGSLFERLEDDNNKKKSS
ncbi:caleosin [Zea mays]|uniref:Caleosin n=3 Tax=Zea mays TaxID=4577 RepID=A0A1D6JTL2_MAIZE|nr:caleosin [Zea mays]ONL95194.1 Caleosin [Zea mays]|eukprot:XP_008680206.1 caleosin isoform X1 [Zea mays]